ncbi:MAG: preprotein translocase subunit YajC [Clostridia bacterium]|nr:preprotein translocase subunit YajC [Clostridia bacterium]
MNFSNFLSAITGDTIFMIVLVVVVLLFLIVFPMFTNKRRQKQVEKLQEGVVVGAEIKTVGGIVGTIIAIREKSPVDKEIVIETGVGDNKSTMVLDMQAVYQVLTPVLKSETSESEEAKVVEENENVAEAESHANDAELFAPVAEVKKEAVEPSETTAEEKAEDTASDELKEPETAVETEKAAVTPSANSSKKRSGTSSKKKS